MGNAYTFPYPIDQTNSPRVCYLSMEFGIHQPLKIYAGGLGFLAGSHLRSAYALRLPLIGVGILWKYGYYDQIRKADQCMDVLFQEKTYGFLQRTEARFVIEVNHHPVAVAVYLLPGELFHTAPLYLLSTDLPENDYLARTITHRLYDSNPETRLAASLLLGIGAQKVSDYFSFDAQVFHLNESHALPLIFHWMHQGLSKPAIRKRLVFTNHTPEPGGNERTSKTLLERMGFTCNVSWDRIAAEGVVEEEILDHTRTAFQFAGRSNGVSKMHAELLHHLAPDLREGRPWYSVTNAQQALYWADAPMYRAAANNDGDSFRSRKRACKQSLFELVADQTGKWLDDQVMTLVFAKRFCPYKRAGLLLQDMTRLERILGNPNYPLQIIWAGKPYPVDYASIAEFDRLVHECRRLPSCAILTGYELSLSRQLKQAADVWLNVPRPGHEASGTSGITASMNGALNVSVSEGWFPEFVQDRTNGFMIPSKGKHLSDVEQDRLDAQFLYDLLEEEILPLYYTNKDKWFQLVRNSLLQIRPAFDSDRMVREYYDNLYQPCLSAT